MGYKDDLYDLIHSLDKAEKRYFKLFASKYEGQEENRYIKLFEILNSFKEYDKETIQKRIKAAKLTKNLIAKKDFPYRNFFGVSSDSHINHLYEIDFPQLSNNFTLITGQAG